VGRIGAERDVTPNGATTVPGGRDAGASSAADGVTGRRGARQQRRPGDGTRAHQATPQ